MRIAHIVTYDSSDGAFGGPTRVAHGHAKALAERGHDVTVYSAAPRAEAGCFQMHGYTVRKFAGRRLIAGASFASMFSGGLLKALVREIRSFDVVHVHLARDLTSMPAALISRVARTPYLLQPHGMLRRAEGLPLRLFDILGTRIAMRGAGLVLSLTDDEITQLSDLARGKKVALIVNGVEVAPVDDYSRRRSLVVFVARLQKRKRPVSFVEMARELALQDPDIEFVMVGPDEGEGASVEEAIEAAGLSARVSWVGGVDAEKAEEWIAAARVLVLPSVGEVFPMTMLEAFRRGTPVVATESLGIAEQSEKRRAALITDGTSQAMANAVRRILSSDSVAQELRAGGRNFVLEELNIARVAEVLEREYLAVTGRQSRL